MARTEKVECVTRLSGLNRLKVLSVSANRFNGFDSTSFNRAFRLNYTRIALLAGVICCLPFALLAQSTPSLVLSTNSLAFGNVAVGQTASGRDLDLDRHRSSHHLRHFRGRFTIYRIWGRRSLNAEFGPDRDIDDDVHIPPRQHVHRRPDDHQQLIQQPNGGGEYERVGCGGRANAWPQHDDHQLWQRDGWANCFAASGLDLYGHGSSHYLGHLHCRITLHRIRSYRSLDAESRPECDADDDIHISPRQLLYRRTDNHQQFLHHPNGRGEYERLRRGGSRNIKCTLLPALPPI